MPFHWVCEPLSDCVASRIGLNLKDIPVQGDRRREHMEPAAPGCDGCGGGRTLFAARCSPHAPPFGRGVLPAPDLKPKPRRGSAGDASTSRGSSALVRTSACSKPGRARSHHSQTLQVHPPPVSDAYEQDASWPVLCPQQSLAAVPPAAVAPPAAAVPSSSPSSIIASSAAADAPAKPSRRRRARAAAKPEEAQGSGAGGPAAAAMKEAAAPRRKVEVGLLPERRGGRGGPGGTSPTAAGAGGRSGANRRGGRAAEAMCSFPMQALSAVNDVLFLRHGYKRMDRHGDPRCASCNARGPCSKVHVAPRCRWAVLYWSLCQRGVDCQYRAPMGTWLYYIVCWIIKRAVQLPMGPYDSVFAVSPRDSQLSQVLERGSGGAAALAILYMEVLSCTSMQELMICKPSPLSLDPHGA